MKSVQSARAPWRDVVLVCRKCARKAGTKSFRKELKNAVRRAGCAKQIRLVDAGCLDLCPKRRIALALGSDLVRRRLIVAAPDAAEAVAAVLTARSEPTSQDDPPGAVLSRGPAGEGARGHG